MSDTFSLLLSYIPIYLGVVLIVFNKQITITYKKLAQRNGSAFPRFITTTRILIGALVLIFMGIIKIIENVS